MKTPTQPQRRALQALVRKWRPRLYLNEWYFDLDYQHEDAEEQEGGVVLAEIDADIVYLQARIKIFPAFWRKDADVREKAIVHELCHCLTQEMGDLLHETRNGQLVTQREHRAAWERLTQRLSYIALYQQGAD